LGRVAERCRSILVGNEDPANVIDRDAGNVANPFGGTIERRIARQHQAVLLRAQPSGFGTNFTSNMAGQSLPVT